MSIETHPELTLLNADRLRAALDAHVLADGGELDRLATQLRGLSSDCHEIANAATAAMLQLETLLSVAGRRPTMTGAQVLDFAGAVRDALADLRALVESAKGRIHITPREGASPVVCPPLLRAVVDDLRERSPGVVWNIEIDADAPETLAIWGGESALRTLLNALLMNAVDGNGERGAANVDIRYRVLMRTFDACLEVVDDGPGFPPAFAEGPIAPYRTTKRGALGLGLFTCQKLVQANRGRMTLINSPEGGAVAAVYLPLKPD